MCLIITLKKGALVGLVISTLVNCYIGIGSILYGTRPSLKPLSTDMCPNSTLTFQTNLANSTVPHSPNTGFDLVFDISYYWYSLIAICIVFVLGTFVSLLTKSYDRKELDDNLLFPCVRFLKKKQVRRSKLDVILKL